MRTDLYWVDGPWQGRLAIMPRPRGGDWLADEVRAWRSAGVDIIVSLLTRDEIAELGLVQEAELCEANGIRFLSLPIVDYGVPASRTDTLDFVKKLDNSLAEGKCVAIHCRGGIGRSALIAACLLVLSGIDPEMAFRRVSTARGCSVPETYEQRQWVVEFARELAPLPTRE